MTGLLLAALMAGLPAAGSSPLLWEDSRIDITYTAGHTRYRFAAEARPGFVMGQTWLERTLLRQGKLDPEEYSTLAERAWRFVSRPDAAPEPRPTEKAAAQEQVQGAGNPFCRSPYAVTVRLGAVERTVRGCRSGGEGAEIGGITRQAEFLLFSAPRS